MAKPSSSPAPASRLPSTRESRPALIGLAVLLIVGGALASAWLAIQAGHRSYFVQVKQEVAQGARITSDDLGRVSLPEGYDGAVSADQLDAIVGQSATTRLLPGTVLIPAMVSKKAGVADNKTQLTISFDDSPFIRSLQPGAQLALATGGSSATGGGGRAVLAELVSVSRGGNSGGIASTSSDTRPIVVSIDISCLNTVSSAITDKAVTLALIGSAAANRVQATCGG